MIENQAYIVALLLPNASPIAIASDEGQAVLERFERTPDDLIDVEKDDRTEGLDNLLKEDILNDVPTDKIDTKDVVEDCYTLEQWKERLSDYDWNKEDWERESDEVREEEERDDEDDSARGGDDEDDDEADDHEHEDDRDEESLEEIRAVMQELAEACEAGNEEACADFREMIAVMMDDRKEKDWDEEWDREEKDWDDEACLTMEEWKKIFDDDKDDRKDDRKGDDVRKNRGPHRDVFVREILEDLEIACDEDDEEACEELEELITKLENDEREREEECDKHDGHDEDDENNHEEEDEDDSENDEPEEA